MSAPQCPPIDTRDKLVARMAYAIAPYAWGSMDHPKCRAQAQANAMKAAERALDEVAKAMAAILLKHPASKPEDVYTQEGLLDLLAGAKPFQRPAPPQEMKLRE